ncbi:MAG: hypothetical protein N2116_04745 [Armatimonadetes bacterium]|nr:hypothetical protein [Armatimonadota bacterium]
MVRGRLVLWDDGKIAHRFMERKDGSVYYVEDDYGAYWDIPGKKLEEVTELDIPLWFRQHWLIERKAKVQILPIVEGENLRDWFEKATGEKLQVTPELLKKLIGK